ncbi:MAG: conjugal transfer protein TraC, partial [Brevinematia bacterium]
MFIKSLAKSLATTIGLVPDREEKESLTKTELRKFWYHNSFSKYLPYGLYDKELGVYYNLDGTVGIFFECVPLLFSSEATLSSLQSTLKSAFPEGSILQFICYADPNVDPFLNAYLENKTNPKVPSFIRKAYESLVEYYKSGINFGAPVRNFRVFVALKFPLKNASESFIKETKSSLRESLVASKLFPVDVVPEVFVSTMRRLFNDNVSPEVEYLWTNYTFLKNQIIFSETEIERSGKI